MRAALLRAWQFPLEPLPAGGGRRVAIREPHPISVGSRFASYSPDTLAPRLACPGWWFLQAAVVLGFSAALLAGAIVVGHVVQRVVLLRRLDAEVATSLEQERKENAAPR